MNLHFFGGASLPKSNLAPWVAKDRLFYSENKPIVHKGFSAFCLIDKFAQGYNISEWLKQFDGYNIARNFTYVGKGWGDKAWNFPSNEVVIEYLRFIKSLGFNSKITLCTDSDTNRIDQINSLVEFLKKEKPTNLLLEAVNEPYIEYDGGLYDKLDPQIFKKLLANSGFLYSSGVYANSHKFYGTYLTDHSARDNKWYSVGGHSLKEFYDGGGPNDPSEPAWKIPRVEDEPIKPEETGYDYLGLYSYAASCVLMGSGATFHSTPGKFCDMLGPKDIECKDYFLKGLNVFPADASYGSYDRIIEDGQHEDSRTYVVGNYSIRIKQKGLEHPQQGWKPLDEYGICWIRG